MKSFMFQFRSSISLAVILAMLTVSVVLAASGDLDSSFHGNGKIIQSFGNSENRGWDLAVQADGKVVAVGEKIFDAGRDIVVARYDTDGYLDTTFSFDGKQTINIRVSDTALSVVVQADGKIVVGGQACGDLNLQFCDLFLVRLNTDGSLDPSFGVDGEVTTDVDAGDNGGFDLILQGTKILAVGYVHDGTSYNGAVYRYNDNGSLDTSFSGDGILPINFGGDDLFHAVTLYGGKIYVAGYGGTDGAYNFIVARVNSNGTLDTTFSGDGKIVTNLGGNDIAFDLVVSGGKVVVVGSSDAKAAIVRYTAAGALDAAFSGDGKLASNLNLEAPHLRGVVIQNGKILVAGGTQGNMSTTGNGLLARFTWEGNLDTTYSTDGIVTTDWGGGEVYQALTIRNSRVYVVGQSRSVSNLFRFFVGAYKP